MAAPGFADRILRVNLPTKAITAQKLPGNCDPGFLLFLRVDAEIMAGICFANHKQILARLQIDCRCY